MKNLSEISGSSLLLKLSNSEAWATCSLQDSGTLALHRWRWVKNGTDGMVATAIHHGGIEVLATLDHVLYAVSDRTKTLTKKNDNPLDYRRENMRYRTGRSDNNTFTTEGDTTIIHFENGHQVYIDTDQLPIVRQYLWRIQYTNDNRFFIVASLRRGGTMTTVKLPHFLLGKDSSDHRHVHYLNGHHDDCRLENLVLVKRKTKSTLLIDDTFEEDDE